MRVSAANEGERWLMQSDGVPEIVEMVNPDDHDPSGSSVVVASTIVCGPLLRNMMGHPDLLVATPKAPQLAVPTSMVVLILQPEADAALATYTT